MKEFELSRRRLLKLSGLGVAAGVLAACQPKVVEVEKIVKETVVVEKEKLVEVEKQVEVEKEVTRVVEVKEAPMEAITIGWATPAGLGLERTMYTNFGYAFTEENPGIKVTLSFEDWNNYFTKIPTMIASGLTPEVIHNHWSIAQDYASKGVFVDHNPFMERDGVDPAEFVPELLAEYAHGGKQWLLPKDSAIYALYYNQDLFDKYGVPYPDFQWSVDDFIQTCLLMTRDADGRPASDPGFKQDETVLWGFNWTEPTPGSDHPLSYILGMSGGPWFNEDFTKVRFGEAGVIAMWEMFNRLRCIQHASPSPGEALGQGNTWRAAQLVAITTDHHAGTFFAKQENVQFRYDVVPPPTGEFGQWALGASSGFGVTANGKYKEEGWKLLNFLTSEKTQAFIGEQKRWGVQRKAIMDAINPTDGKPEHFADIHTRPWQENYDGPLKKYGAISVAGMSRIKEAYDTLIGPLMTCLEGNVAEAAAQFQKEGDQILAENQW